MATIKKGTYRFKDILKISELGVTHFADLIKFKTNGISCIGMSTIVTGLVDYLSYEISKTESINAVYVDGVWEDEAYKIIEVTEDYESPSADFATFFAENAELIETTITAGTYRFNDVLIPPEEGQSFTVNMNFECTASVNHPDYGSIAVHAYFHAMNIGSGVGLNGEPFTGITWEITSTTPDLGFSGNYIWVSEEGGWCTNNYGEGIKTITITITEDTAVSAEFAEWFTANAVENKQISGKWRFNDQIFCYPYERYQIPASPEEKIGFLKTYGALCKPIDLSSIQEGLYANCFSMANSFGDMYVDGQPTVFDSGVYIGMCADGEYTGIDVISVEYLYGQTVDLGTEPQYVSVDFYNWLTANANEISPSATTITYNGKTIASLMAGQTATLKCKGDNVKMLSDIVVKAADNVGGSNANIVPLVVSANGTYNNPTLPIVETWGTDTIFDLSLDYNGVTVGIKKVGSIPFPDDVSALMVKGNTLTLTIADAETKEVHSVQTFPFDDYAENIIDLDGTGAVIIDELGILCFVKDASIANKTFGVTWFEDNTVYVSNAVDLSLDDEYWYECKLYLQEGNVSADGYNPVVVDVPIPEGYVLPNGDYSIDRNGTYNITYYSNVIVNTPTIYFVKSTADLPVNAANGSIAYVLGGT